MKSYVSIILVATILGACSQQLTDNGDPKLPSRISLKPGANDYGSGAIDSVDNGASQGDYYILQGIRFDDDKLVVTVGYSGGCGTHSFEVQGELLPVDSDPLQASIAVVHSANGDSCEAWVTEEIEIDLMSLLGTTSADLQIFNPSQNETRYSFLAYRHMPQGNECVVETTFEQALCGTGIYGDKWFRVKNEELYLQPVSIGFSIDDTLLQEGKSYRVGFWNTYWSGDSTVTCMAYPGPSVMAEISCIEAVE